MHRSCFRESESTDRDFFLNNPTLVKQKRNNHHVKFEATEKRSLVSRNHTILEELETKGSTIPWRELLWNLWTSTSIPVHQELPIEMKTEEQVETPSISSQQERETRVRNESQLWRLAARYDGDERASRQGESSSSEKHRREVVRRRTGKAAGMWQAAMATRGALGSPPTDW